MQIGENTKKLSKELKQRYPEVAWVLIGDMRNRFAHGYEVMHEDIIWDVAVEYVPSLKVTCEQILSDITEE